VNARIEQSQVGIISFVGELKFEQAEECRKDLEKLVKEQPEGEVVLDLAAVTDLDSSALSLLLCAQRACSKGKELTLTNVPAGMQSLAELVGLKGILKGL